MRNKLQCAFSLVFASALATGSALAGQPTSSTQTASESGSRGNHTSLAQTGNGGITVPPGVARGYGNYPDGTPCIGTPKDPTAWPDKKNNPCDGKPLSPERIPGPYPPVIAPPVNVTAPGGQTVPPSKPQEPEPERRAGQFAAYEDGTPCIGRPKDLFRRPNKQTNPCVPVEEAKSTEPNGNQTPIPGEEKRTGGSGVISFAPPAKPGARPVPTIKQRPDGSLYIEYPQDRKPGR